jgi:hypothetical protein
VYLGIKHPSGAYDQIFTVRKLGVCWCGAFSLTRGLVCRLQLLLAIASAVIVGSESRWTRNHILLLQIRDFHFRRVLRLAGLRWRYLTPPPHGMTSRTASYIAYQYPRKCRLIPQRHVGFQESNSVETTFIFVSQETCCVTSWFPRINLYGNVFVNSFPSNGSTCHNIYQHFFQFEDGGSTFLRNDGKHLPGYKTSHNSERLILVGAALTVSISQFYCRPRST